MKEIELIKDFYKPIKPTIKIGQKDVIYREIQSDHVLTNFAYCFWQLKTTRPLKDPFIYRVVSDGCIDIFLDHHNPVESFVMGSCRKYTEFPIGKEFDYIGIRFFPSMFPLLFGINAKKLSHQSQELKFVLPRIAEFIANVIYPEQQFAVTAEMLSQMVISETDQHDFYNFDPKLHSNFVLTKQYRMKSIIVLVFLLMTGLAHSQENQQNINTMK